MKVLLVEEKHLGGVCLNWGCIPTKALLTTTGYDINIDGFYKTAILRKPIEVKYYTVFRAECERLGYKCGVKEK